MMRNVFRLFYSYDSLRRYCTTDDKAYDLLFYLVYVIQVSILMSYPNGDYDLSWNGFFLCSAFELIFYPMFYFSFYFRNKSDFLREVIVYSSVVRIHAFISVGMLALLQMIIGVCSFDVQIKNRSRLRKINEVEFPSRPMHE